MRIPMRINGVIGAVPASAVTAGSTARTRAARMPPVAGHGARRIYSLIMNRASCRRRRPLIRPAEVAADGGRAGAAAAAAVASARLT